MDVLSADWQCELGMEDPHLIGECPAHDDSADYSVDEFILSPLSPQSFPSYVSPTIGGSEKQLSEQDRLETNHWNSFTPENMVLDESLSASYVASSTHSLQLNRNPNCNIGKSKETQTAALNLNNSNDNNSDAVVQNCRGTGKVQATSRPPAQAKNHIVAERKRRERLNQKLIALSALIPGLKKMDKASIIGDAINYIKRLKEHVETLERKMDGSTGRSPKRFRTSDDDDSTPPTSDYLCGNSNQVLPNIEATVRDKNVLVRIHCKTLDGVIEKVLREMQAVNLDVMSSSIVPFGNVSLDITIIAQMTAEFGKTEKELVEILRQLF